MNQKASPSAGAKPGSSVWPRILVVVGLLIAGGVIRAAMTQTPTTPAGPAPIAPLASPASAPPAGAISKSVGEVVAWDQATQPGPTTYAVGTLVLTASSSSSTEGPRPTLDVTGPEGDKASLAGVAGLPNASLVFAVGRVDAAAPGDQVIFETYSGGAHCCQTIELLERLGGAWKVTPIAQVDGDALTEFPKALAPDGHVEFKLVDNRFLYAFASYASSWAPPSLLVVEKGQVRDVSAEPRFRPIFEAYLDQPRADCEKNHNNGACAAFVAAAARLGKLDWAWPMMLAAYDRGHNWVLPSPCGTQGQSPCAPDQALAFTEFPASLAWFLGDAGYGPKVYVAPDDTSGPSFPCAGVTSGVLKLVCQVPLLTKADRELAIRYGHALAFSTDPASTREAERAFVQTRNNAPADAFVLLRLYEARLAALSDDD